MTLPIILTIICSSLYMAAFGFSLKEGLKFGVTEWWQLYLVGPTLVVWYSMCDGLKLVFNLEYRYSCVEEELEFEDLLDQSKRDNDNETS